jgi:hypothetical protein
MNSDHTFILAVGIFVGFLSVVSSFADTAVVQGENSEPPETIGTSACQNIGGFDAVGDILGCVTGEIDKYTRFTNIATPNPTINRIIITPIGLAVGWITLNLIRGN